MSRTIVSLAVLRTLYDKRNQDALDPFVPFVANLVMDAQPLRLDPAGLQDFCRLFRDTYGLHIPQHPMTTLLKRAQDAGYVVRTNHDYSANDELVRDLGLDEARQSNSQLWGHTVAAFAEFCQTNHNCQLSDTQADAAFHAFLRERDIQTLFAAHQQGSPIPDVAYSSKHVYLAGQFTLWSADNMPDLFAFIVSMCTGHVLATALFYDSLVDYSSRLASLYVYLDAPILLQLLGISPPARVDAAHEFLTILSSSSVTILAFEHTVEEVVTLLENSKEWIDRLDYDPVLASATTRFVRETGMSKSDVATRIHTLRDDLEGFGIRIRSAPHHSVDVKYQIDEGALEDTIVGDYSERLGYFNYPAKKQTILIDITSLSAIHKLRRGRRTPDLAQARHVFVTGNAGLARASRLFERSQQMSRRTIPACVTDVFLGTLAWLQSPHDVTRINTKRVLSDCLTATKPSKALIMKLLHELDRLFAAGDIDDNEYYAIRTDPASAPLLSDLTMNDPDAYTPQTAHEFLEAYRNKHRREAMADYAEEVKAHQSTSKRLEGRERHDERIASVIAAAIATLILLASTALWLWADASNLTIAKYVAAILGIVGVGTFGLSVAAHGWVYRFVIRVLTPPAERAQDKMGTQSDAD